jgi:hypothetical protein
VALLQVALATSKKVPVPLAPVVPSAVEVVICPARSTRQPLLAAAMDAETAPDADAVPDTVVVDPEIGAKVPVIVPPSIVQVNVPVRFEPSDWPPLHVPSYVPSNWPTPVLAVNVAVTVLFAFMTSVHGLAGSEQSPLQPVKADPGVAVAAMLTVVPWG